MPIRGLLTAALSLFLFASTVLAQAPTSGRPTPTPTPTPDYPIVIHIDDLGTGKPLAGVTVTIVDAGSRVRRERGATDGKGDFRTRLPGGKYQLEYSLLGYLRKPECKPLPYPACAPWDVAGETRVEGDLFKQDGTLEYFADVAKAILGVPSSEGYRRIVTERINAQVSDSARDDTAAAAKLYTKMWNHLSGLPADARARFSADLAATAPAQYQEALRDPSDFDEVPERHEPHPPRNHPQSEHVSSESFPAARLNENDYPFVVKLIRTQPNGDLVCGGVAIDARWVLTSAQCVRKNAAVPADGVVPAGAPAGSPVDVYPFTAFCHPNFKPGRDTVDDLALLLVAGKRLKPFGGKIVAERSLQDGEAYVALGWGRPIPGALRRSQVLAAVPDPDCEMLYKGQIMEDNEICAGSKESAPCRFDSGGPLFIAREVLGQWSERELTGVVSKADDDCKNLGPAIFAGFSAAELQWIREVLAGNGRVRASSLAACHQ